MIWFFIGGAVVAALAIALLVFRVRRGMKKYLGTADLKKILGSQELEDTEPRSISGGDSIYLPLILRDFPDFNLDRAKDLVREELKGQFGSRPDFRIHRVALSDYHKTPNERVIVFQASLQYREEGTLLQKKYSVQYAWLMKETGGAELAVNCPNCGAPITDIRRSVCPYCGSQVFNITGNSWKFISLAEM